MGFKDFFMEEARGDKKQKNQTKVSTWLIVLIWVFIGFNLISIIFLSESPENSAYDLGSMTFSIIIAFFSANKCSKWAKEINKSMNLAYLVGFFLMLLGLLIYYIYYRSKKGYKEDDNND
jgi:ABC-type Fe3+ transport system permease subunit